MSIPTASLIALVNRNGDINDPRTLRPLVSLEEFFEGNDDYGSIGYNFGPDQPSPAEFYEQFKQIRSRPDVADVRVQISQHDDPRGWPQSDTIWVITRAWPEQVAAWLRERFQADEILVGWPEIQPVELYFVPAGTRPIGVWWD